jgi:hypothetical protein
MHRVSDTPPDLHRRLAPLSSILGIDCRATHDRLDAPWVIDGPMNRPLFDIYVKTQVALTLIACHASAARCLTGHFRPKKEATDNLSSHKNLGAAAAVKGVGAWFVFLSPYSPDLNPVEMAFTKLKARIRRAAVRRYDALWRPSL